MFFGQELSQCKLLQFFSSFSDKQLYISLFSTISGSTKGAGMFSSKPRKKLLLFALYFGKNLKGKRDLRNYAPNVLNRCMNMWSGMYVS